MLRHQSASPFSLANLTTNRALLIPLLLSLGLIVFLAIHLIIRPFAKVGYSPENKFSG
jgi:hypothetical protein